MVQAPSKTVFNPKGTQHSNSDSSIVSLAPTLPFYVEVRTGSLKSLLMNVYNHHNKDNIQVWLTSKQKTGFYFEISDHLHIAFSDQRDGTATPYWWIIYYDNHERKRVIENVKVQEHLVSTKVANNLVNENLLWNGVTFKSATEKKIAQILYTKNVIFFAGSNAFMDLKGLPITNYDNKNQEKTEVDFLVFYNQKCMILEVDGVHHNLSIQRNWDCKRDRIFLRQGITTVRFSAEQCYTNPLTVVEEFLALFNNQSSKVTSN